VLALWVSSVLWVSLVLAVPAKIEEASKGWNSFRTLCRSASGSGSVCSAYTSLHFPSSFGLPFYSVSGSGFWSSNSVMIGL
jgi:hypothetical protein